MAAHSVGVVKEADPAEQRVAVVPEVVPKLRDLGLEVLVENDAGAGAWFSDSAYTEAGASVRPASRGGRRRRPRLRRPAPDRSGSPPAAPARS